MNILRTVRRSRALTLFELARSTGLSARLIAEAEYGLRQLSDQEYAQLAVALELPVEALRPQPMAPIRQPLAQAGLLAHWALLVGGVMVLLFLLGFGAVYTPPLWPWHTPAMAQEAGPMLTVSPSATPIAPETATAMVTASPMPTVTATHEPTPTATASPIPTVTATHEPTPTATASPMPTVTATHEPTPTATSLVLNEPVQPAGVEQQIVAPAMVSPLFVLTEKGPLGCPLQPSQGHVVMTQGYGVGSHAPADVWGAVDLAVVDSTRGYKDITKYTPVAATHDGIVYVSLGSWPGGNHVSIVDPATGWRTGYAHLAYVFLESGTAVTAGNYIGLAGDTGHATGPHLDYQVWYGDTNIDPTGLVQGCR